MSDTNESATEGLKVEIISEPTSSNDIQSLKTPEPISTGYKAVQDFLGMASTDNEQQEKLQYIWESFSKGRDRDDTLDAINEAYRRLSPPDVGQTYLHKLFAYTRLIEDGRSIEKEKKIYESNS